MSINVTDIKKVGVIGAGTMGSGIAQIISSKGLDVKLIDIDNKSLQRGKSLIEKSLTRLVKKDALAEDDFNEILSRIHTSADFNELSDVDLVIEAVIEDMAVKLDTYKKLDEVTRDEVVLATNTSSLPIIEIAVSTKRPEKVVGIHFFNPAPVMKLVEIIRSIATSEQTYQFAYDFAKYIGKEPVKTKDHPGFIVNRILIPMLNEAVLAHEDGVGSPEDIDKAMKLGTNHPIGPMALIDLIGADVVLDIMDVFYEEFKDSKYRAAPLLRKMVRAGWLGKKTGRGFYEY